MSQVVIPVSLHSSGVASYLPSRSVNTKSSIKMSPNLLRGLLSTATHQLQELKQFGGGETTRNHLALNPLLVIMALCYCGW